MPFMFYQDALKSREDILQYELENRKTQANNFR